MASAAPLFAQAPKSVDGHVFHAEDRTPCGDALIQAWPCGATFAAGTDGRFVASCSVGIDSLTVLAHGREMETVQVVEGTTHHDVDLWWLAITLEDAAVQATTSEEGYFELKKLVHRGDEIRHVRHSPRADALFAQVRERFDLSVEHKLQALFPADYPVAEK